MPKTPTALSGTSPKSDRETLNNNPLSPVVFGGGRRGSGVVARVESLRGRMSEGERQALP